MRDAVEAERAQTRAWLHDSVLQVLEYLAAGGYADEPDAAELSRIAADAATELRAFVEGREAEEVAAGEGELCARLNAAVEAERELGEHEIGIVFGEFERAVDGAAAEQLASAAREALRNTRKHASATRALVTADVVGGVATVIVSDDGAGFDLAAVRQTGAGLRESIVGRLGRAGGSATVRSRPGHGTRVTLRLPLAEPTAADPVAESPILPQAPRERAA
ncbi:MULTISPECIES: sensor histidine kinase [unclassified Conexibacter]|uniref:sensor histidine kinase n=1 Tax=unclassified Conexibacter TaxID=2627773 RepID=UPI0027223A76|nr:MULTISPECIES: ATP-binding protein [unclassified Conexibacter]MDO8186284.1 ATP-binding protein [Conexibacter sp. CPCC 205706]